MATDSITKKVELNRVNVERFYELYGNLSLTWALDNLLEAFIQAHDVSPKDLMALGAKELKRRMSGNDSVSDV